MTYGTKLRERITAPGTTPLIGVYDMYSASITAQHYDAMFVSGFGFAASYYGLPDIGFIAWPDMMAFVQRLRGAFPGHHLLVDIDDGYGDPEVACHVVSLLEAAGASGVILEDQQRPRRCGHLEGKQILPLDQFVGKLERVLETRREMVVVARTDASDAAEIRRRAKAFDAAGADAILVDGQANFDLIRTLKAEVGRPLAFNQIAGGKSPRCSLPELAAAGISLAIYSTPCLFAAQAAVATAIGCLKQTDGILSEPAPGRAVGLKECAAVLQENLTRRTHVAPENS